MSIKLTKREILTRAIVGIMIIMWWIV